MKKLTIAACAILALAAASCGKCDDAKCGSATPNDSLSTAYGEYVGSMIYGDFEHFTENPDKSSKQEFLRGMQIVFGADDSRNARLGMQVALQMMGEIQQFEAQGIKVNKAAIMNAFKESFLADSMSYMDAQMRGSEFQLLYKKATDEAQKALEAEKAQQPSAVENAEAAEKYVAELKAANSNVQTTDNGLTYLIEVPGEATHPDENATVVVNYTGKHLNGEVFDSTDGRGPATFNLQGVVPGFREGLMLIGKGGKATLYIPGNLAYGPNGQPAAGIGPNEMLVFDVELLDVAAE